MAETADLVTAADSTGQEHGREWKVPGETAASDGRDAWRWIDRAPYESHAPSEPADV
jgi:hypothetical protein